MAKRESFWNQKRLSELRRLFKSFSQDQLMDYYNRSFEDIKQAYEFQEKHRKMKLTSKREKGHTITVYAAAYAEGSRGHNSESLDDSAHFV